MFRKLTFAAVTGLGLLALAPAAKADAFVQGHFGPRPHYHPQPRQFVYQPHRVYYRQCAADPWAIYRAYPGYRDAYRASFRLQARGFEVFVR